MLMVYTVHGEYHAEIPKYRPCGVCPSSLNPSENVKTRVNSLDTKTHFYPFLGGVWGSFAHAHAILPKF